MENQNQENTLWQANYYFRTKTLATKKLKEYIEFLGQREAAEKFGCSEASCKAWRYGYRQPTINQAKQIIKATDGRLDFESIYGPVSEILVTEA